MSKIDRPVIHMDFADHEVDTYLKQHKNGSVYYDLVITEDEWIDLVLKGNKYWTDSKWGKTRAIVRIEVE